MMKFHELISECIHLLNQFEFCEQPKILETSFFSNEQFALKIRATIFSSLTFQIRIYANQEHFDYSYQVFSDEPVCRWDNKEHFPEIKTFPHHFHSLDGSITDSPLTGMPLNDLKIVLEELAKMESHLSK